jgi:hypothetical protein
MGKHGKVLVGLHSVVSVTWLNREDDAHAKERRDEGARRMEEERSLALSVESTVIHGAPRRRLGGCSKLSRGLTTQTPSCF